MNDWIRTLFEHPDMARMGHAQRPQDLNLGLGWVYYSLARVLRPARVVVVGSYRGFVPLVLGKALADNGEGGEVLFIDPSYVDNFWADPLAVQTHFAKHGVTNIRHFLMTTQEFVITDIRRTLGEVGILFVDGYHTEEQARFDYEAFKDVLSPQGVTLFHDSIRIRTSRIYGQGREYEHHVKSYIEQLTQDPGLQVFDLPFGDGVTLVRRNEKSPG